MTVDDVKELASQFSFYQDMGYTHLRVINGQICGLHQFIFTTGLMVGLNPINYDRRYCYEHEADALAALEKWDGKGHPTGPWIKAKGPNIDMLNPELTA